MAKKLLFLLLLLSITTSGNCRSYGVKIGKTSSNQVWETWSNVSTERLAGNCYGFFIDWLEIFPVQLRTEFDIYEKGMVYSLTLVDDEGPVTEDFENKLIYLSCPILLKYRHDLGLVKPYILFGLRYDLLLSYESDLFKNIFERFNNIMGLSYGVGIEFLKSFPVSPLIEFRYDTDLTLSFDELGIDIKNNSYSINGGIKF